MGSAPADDDDPDSSQIVDLTENPDFSRSPDTSFGPPVEVVAPRFGLGLLVLALGLGVCWKVWTAAPPSPGLPSPAPTPTGPGERPPPPPDEPARLTAELQVIPDPSARTYLDDYVRFVFKVTADQACDLSVPGPPWLELRFKEAQGERIAGRPNPLREKNPQRIPLSLEAGEGIEIGPMPLSWFDVDPRVFRPEVRYRVEARYLPGEPVAVTSAQVDALMVPRPDLEFPEGLPPAADLSARPVAPLKLLDAKGRVRRYFEWSPDTGYSAPEE